jgi:hypothetical protein
MALSVEAWRSALKPVIQAGLRSIYEQMHAGDTAKDDEWHAEQLAELLSDAISSTGTAQIKTAGIPVGKVIVSVAGQATGTPNAAEIIVE